MLSFVHELRSRTIVEGGVRNLLMVPSRRRAQVLKATKLTEVSEVRDEEEEPQCNGRGEGGQGDNLEGSNDGKSAREV